MFDSRAVALVDGDIHVLRELAGKVAPVVLIGYVLVRLLSPKRKRISEADRRWLEGK